MPSQSSTNVCAREASPVNNDSNDMVEACCYIFLSHKLILSKYKAESIITDCRTFWPHRPLSTAYKTVLNANDEGLCDETVLPH